MTAHTSSGLAHRIGFGLGRAVSVLFASGASPLLWLARAVLVVAAVIFMFAMGSWLAAAGMTIASIATVLWALSRVDLTANNPAANQTELFGTDVFGRKLNWLGELEVPDQSHHDQN
ncbi:hypothetical protein [Pseudomonas chlororaphis]|uniref:hypothetical protein n=1 Tax=Pseudomonas chlororaphis TaxID=587753 RepID=UPI00132FCA1D|nr:hypothetical protein [Pseudomonas chlororaphis]